MIDSGLYQFANVRQLEVLEAITKYGSNRKAALALNLSKSTVDEHVNRVKAKAEAAGYMPQGNLHVPIPNGYQVKGTSTLYDSEGKVAAQWIKTQVDPALQQEMLQAAIKGATDKLPRLLPLKPPKKTAQQLCNVFTLTDSHVGMLAWAQETGADWDLEIAENTLVGCFDKLVMQSPEAGTAVIAQLGDFLHYDSLEAVTPTSKHLVDADGRYAKMVRVAIRILRRVIDLALQRHDKVVVLMAEGNHDLASSVWLRLMFAALYENEPRIEVIDSELPYYTYVHGKTMLAWHHGHLSKNDRLPLLFATQYPQVWGNTTKRYAHTGHRHHVEVKEHSGMTVIQHSTLAAKDAYAARGGWASERQITGYTYHADHGQVGTITVTPEMLQ